MGHLLFGFSGRVNRAKWWLSFLVMIIIYAVLIGAPQAFASDQEMLIGVLGLVGAVLYIWIYLAAGAKRLHDLNKSGAWLVVFILGPIILTIIFLAVAWSAIGPSIMAGQTPGQAELAQILGIVAIFSLLSLGFFLWWLIWFGCLRGTVGPNQYGPDPLEGKI